MAKGKDYFGLGRLISIILAIIPVTAWLCGWLTRFKEGKIIAGIIRLLFGWNIIWILDLILMILNGKILRILNCQFKYKKLNNKPENKQFSGLFVYTSYNCYRLVLSFCLASYLATASLIRRSTSGSNFSPAASHIFGNMLIGVKPGIVLISFK